MLVALGLRSVFVLLLTVAWETVRLLNGADWSWDLAAWRWLMVTVALGLNLWAAGRRRRWFFLVGLLLGMFAISSWWNLREPDTRLAWLATTTLVGLLLAFESAFWYGTRTEVRRLAWLEYSIGLSWLAAVGGATLAGLGQIEAHFAEEEFFAALQAVFLIAFCLILLLLQVIARCRKPTHAGVCFGWRPLWGMAALLVALAGLAWWSVRAYQTSFYSPSAPGYDGITQEVPFLCAVLPATAGQPDGERVFDQILERIERNPQKGVPEYGMLALATGESRWADAFREAILAEAKAGAFTQAANSVKYGQRLAALRVYYFARVIETFPDLFNGDELTIVKDWFADVNRRAMTVEWVDLLYGVAFSVWPEGPYENQETGAGLLALLESFGLGDDGLSEANRDYLARNVRGWIQRYRNTDDAYTYQAEWVDNATFQEIFQGRGDDPEQFEQHRRLAFEWLLLQILPGGEALNYNRPGTLPLANTFYLGALLLDDPRYVWAAEQSLAHLDPDTEYLYAQPGLDHAATLTGKAPTEGSCLLFSPSGLPTKLGPLAPDKIVFRDGWTEDATYLLVNLRFTGWHRYKATNGITLLYQGDTLVGEDTGGQAFAWLPSGRSHFRDKRIPRENLNGLLIPRTGFSQVIYSLTGLNGPWAQDPPHYARVEDFSTMGILDTSRTVIDDWRGWQHERSIYFLHQGPVIVVDDARHDGGGESAVTWQLGGSGHQANSGLWLREGDNPVQLALSPNSWSATALTVPDGPDSDGWWNLTYASPDSGRLGLVSTFLMNGWGEAEHDIHEIVRGGELIGQYVRLSNGSEEIRVLHNGQRPLADSSTSTVIAADGMSTDGLALLTFGQSQNTPHTVCLVGGSAASVQSQDEPGALRIVGQDIPLQRGTDWYWAAGLLTLHLSSPASICFTIE